MEMPDENVQLDHEETNENTTEDEPKEHDLDVLDEPEEGEILCTDINSTKDPTREILIQMGLNRNKVFNVTEGSSLSEQFETFITEDPAFSKLSRKSHLILQIFNPKFQSWVELENEDELKDGSIVKALFFPVDVCADEKNPENLTRKRKHSGSRSQRGDEDEDDDCDEEEDRSASSDNSRYGEDCREEVVYEPLVKRRSRYHDRELNSQIATYASREDSDGSCNSLQLCCNSTQSIKPLLGNELVVDRMLMKTPVVDIRFRDESFFLEKIEWTKYFAKMSIPFWKSVIFSHSTYFMLKNNRITCLNKCCFDMKEKSVCRSFWCAMTHHGPHIIVPMESTLNSNILFKILHDGIIPLSRKLQAHTRGPLMLQYSYELQTQFLGKKIVKYLQRNPIKLLEWPMFVSNINPMNAFWAAVETKLQGKRVHSVNSMAKAVIETCLYDLDIKNTCKYLVESMPRLLQCTVDEEKKEFRKNPW